MRNSAFNSNFIKRYIKYFENGKGMIALSTCLSIVFSGLAMAIPYFAGKAIDCIVDNGLTDMTSLRFYILLLVLLIILSSVSQFVLLRINNKLAYNASKKLREDSYNKVGKLPVSFLDRTYPGNIQSMIISDIETVSDGTILFLNQFASGIVSILFTLGIMLFINWKIALFVLVFTPLSFFVSNFIAKRTFNSFKNQADCRAMQTSFINEMTNNFRESKLFDITGDNINQFKTINDSYREISSKATFYSSITNPSTRFINSLVYAGVALIGSIFVLGGGITVGALSSLLAYANQFMKPFNDLSSVYTEISDSFACLSRVFGFLDEEDIDEDLNEINDEHIWDLKEHFSVEFKNVSFSYSPGKKVLDNVSFRIEAGQSFALVGPTGCGKTTLINLLMRYYEPDSGDILINDRSIYSMSRNELRRYIGFVPQDTWFREGTIFENISYGNTNLTLDEACEFAKKTDAHSFIRKLPNKYNEQIKQSRDYISEGQRQLLSITRALASDPSIMILDEATSSVDVLTEVKIQKAVKELLNGRTGIIIAHRLSTIIDCDEIVVLDKGKVVEKGNHDSLIGNGGFYSSLYSSYTK